MSRLARPSLASNTSLHLTDASMWGQRLSGARSTNDLDQFAGALLTTTMGVQPPAPSVPSYRPAPDYETAVLTKYGGGVPHQLAHFYSSQPRLHPLLSQQNPPLDLPFPTSTRDPDFLSPGLLPSGFPLNTPHTYSTPELNTADTTQAPLSVYSPPPPYPPPEVKGAPFSSSTPDLASQTRHSGGQVDERSEVREGLGIGGSSPDLVSRRTLGAAAIRPSRHSQPREGDINPDIHRTYDNLSEYDDRDPRGGGRSVDRWVDISIIVVLTRVINDYYRSLDNLDMYRHQPYTTEVRHWIYKVYVEYAFSTFLFDVMNKSIHLKSGFCLNCVRLVSRVFNKE